MRNKIARALANNPELAVDLYLLASEIVDDYEEWGPVLQSNVISEYGEDTAIEQLRTVRNALIDRLRHLTAS